MTGVVERLSPHSAFRSYLLQNPEALSSCLSPSSLHFLSVSARGGDESRGQRFRRGGTGRGPVVLSSPSGWHFPEAEWLLYSVSAFAPRLVSFWGEELGGTEHCRAVLLEGRRSRVAEPLALGAGLPPPRPVAVPLRVLQQELRPLYEALCET